MKSSHIEVFTRLRQAREVIDALLLRAADGGGRAALLAEMAQFLWPGAALAACVLRGEEDAAATALDGAGAPRPEWAALIRDELTWRWAAHRDAAPRTPLAEALGLSRYRIVLENVHFRERVYGALLLAVPNDDPADGEAVRAMLAACAQHLALSLAVEALEREREALADEATSNARMAEIAEASIPVAHEFNNFLNALLLHTAVLKYQLPEAMHQGLADLRQQAMSVAGLIQQFQHYRRRQPSAHAAVDLNVAIRAAVEALAARGEAAPSSGDTSLAAVVAPGGAAGIRVPVRLELAAEAVAPGPWVDLKRLCTFLIRNAAGAAAAAGGEITIRTTFEGGRLTLRVEDGGAAAPPERLPHLFEPGAPGREGTNPLELAACKTLARRLQAALRVENGVEGGAAFVAEWAPQTASGGRQPSDSAPVMGSDAESEG